jgi:demethylmenaquinone methyltransferase/2-methoxy-6-polyprenyl-1,4-benzoquinol methylase
MFAAIAPCYDRMNATMTFASHRRWRRSAIREINLKPGCDVLDLCTGTGDFLNPIRSAVKSEGTVVGLDFCPPMLQQAATKQVPGSLMAGDACALPFGSESFDGVTVGWGLRNVADLDAALHETFRVLKPGGRFACLDMAQPKGVLGRFGGRILDRILPRLGALYGVKDAYTYLPESAKRFATREALADSMAAAGFTEIRFRDFAFGHVCLHIALKP